MVGNLGSWKKFSDNILKISAAKYFRLIKQNKKILVFFGSLATFQFNRRSGLSGRQSLFQVFRDSSRSLERNLLSEVRLFFV